jgi:hypothetical protein
MGIQASVVRPTLLYIGSEAVIPAPISIGINSSGNPAQKYWIPVKPGMTITVNGLLMQ